MTKNWETSEFGDLTDNFDSERIPVRKSNRKEGPYPYYGASGITDFVDDYIFDGEYLLIAEDGENLRSRKSPIAFMARGQFWVNNHAHVVKGNERADTRFLMYALRQANVSGYITGSAQPKLSQTNLNKIPTKAPSLPTQRRIAGILGAFDDKIELNRQVNATLEAMAQTWYHRLFEGGVGVGDVSLTDLVELNPRSRVPDDDEVLPYVGMRSVEPNQMSVPEIGRKEYTSGRRFRNQDTIMARITPSLENGKTAYVDFLSAGEMAFGSTEFTVMRPQDGVSPCFPYCCARDDQFREYAISTMTGSSGRQRVQEKLLGEWCFADYSTEDMDRFHEKAKPLFDLITSKTRENRTLAETRDYLLPKLISGEIAVDAAEETAAKSM